MGLTLSEEKTKVTHITEGFDFLGYRVIRSIGTKGKMVPKVLVPEKAINRFRIKYAKYLPLVPPRSQQESRYRDSMAHQRVVRILQKYE